LFYLYFEVWSLGYGGVDNVSKFHEFFPLTRQVVFHGVVVGVKTAGARHHATGSHQPPTCYLVEAVFRVEALGASAVALATSASKRAISWCWNTATRWSACMAPDSARSSLTVGSESTQCGTGTMSFSESCAIPLTFYCASLLGSRDGVNAGDELVPLRLGRETICAVFSGRALFALVSLVAFSAVCTVFSGRARGEFDVGNALFDAVEFSCGDWGSPGFAVSPGLW